MVAEEHAGRVGGCPHADRRGSVAEGEDQDHGSAREDGSILRSQELGVQDLEAAAAVGEHPTEGQQDHGWRPVDRPVGARLVEPVHCPG